MDSYKQRPIGAEFADKVEQGVASGVQGAVNWWQDASQDQEGVLDDILRATEGGVKNIGNWWTKSTADQEGIGDDILRGVGSIAGAGMRVLDAGSYYGGKLGGGFATMIGVDARIGGAIGNIGGELAVGFGAKKLLQTGRLASQVDYLRKRGHGLQAEHIMAAGKGQGYSFAFDTAGDLATDQAGIMDMLFAKPKTRKLIAKSAKRAELEQLIMKHQTILETVEPVLIDGKMVKVWPGSDKDLIKSARKLIKLKEEIGIPSAKDYVHELGAHVADGHLSRITGGHAKALTKDPTDIGQFQSRKGFWERQGRENIWPADEDPLRRKLSRLAGAPEKHHVRILETSRPFAMVEDGKGGLKLRDQAQLDRVAARLRKETNLHLGNQDFNELFLSVDAHRTGDFAAHKQIINWTDIQRPGTYAEADFVEVVLEGAQNPKWLKQIKVDDAGELLKNPYLLTPDGKRRIPLKAVTERKRFAIQGRTYQPGQMHGFSQELQMKLAKLTKDDDLFEAIKLYYEITDEPLKGAAALASNIHDASLKVDKLTKELRQQYLPEMLEWIEHLEKQPKFKKDKRLLKLKKKYFDQLDPVQREVKHSLPRVKVYQ